MALKIIIIIVYLGIVGILGFLGWRRTKNAEDYMLGGRKIHPAVMALSYGATFISTSAIVGFGGFAGIFGMSLLWLTFLNIFLGIFIAFIFFGKRTRRIGRNLDAHTFPELLGKRYNSKFIQKFAGLIIFIFMPIYAAAVMIGVCMILAAGLGISYEIALAVFAVLVAAYVIFGGIKGVMYSDAFQGSLMLLGMIALLVIVYTQLGGVTPAHQALTDLGKNSEVIAQTATAKFAPGFQGWTSMPAAFSINWMVVVTSIVAGVGIGVLAQPQLAVRFMTVKSDKELNRAIPIGGVFILLMTGVAFLVGALSNVLFFQETGSISALATMIDGKIVVDNIIPAFLNTFTSPWFVTIFLVMMLAAGMSTISSQFHTMGTAVGRDVFGSSKKDASGKKSMIATRIAVLVAILVTVTLSYILPQIWSGAIAIATGLFFGLCGASFLPMYFGALYFKKLTKTAAISGMVAGFSSSLLWMILFHAKEAKVFGLVNAITGGSLQTVIPDPILSNLDPLFIALTMSILVTIIVQICSKKKLPAELVKQSFEGIGKK